MDNINNNDISSVNDVNDVRDDVIDDGRPNSRTLSELHNNQMASFYYFYNGPARRSFANMFKTPFRTSRMRGIDWLNELLTGHEDRFTQNLRLTLPTFLHLCDAIRHTGIIPEHDRCRVLLEESVAIFLQTIGMHNRQTSSAERFQRSTETISRHTHMVCNALCRMAPLYIVPPDMTIVLPEIERNPRLYPFFKDCVGAIDGTIVPGWCPAHKQGTYRSRKAVISQNVMAACDFDLKFTFVLSGWEGSANDSRIFLDALRTPEYNFPWPPPGKYYFVDSGYTNFPGFLAPYRNERYHIPEWRGENRAPRSIKEFYNRYHSSGRNHIERTFGNMPRTEDELLAEAYRAGSWTPQQEASLITRLHDAANFKNIMDPRVFLSVCGRIATVLSRMYGTSFTCERVVLTVYRLRTRFFGFLEFCDLPGIVYDDHTNVITADDAYWDHIGQETPKQRRFRTGGEPMYMEFHFVFVVIGIPDETPLQGVVPEAPIELSDDVGQSAPPPSQARQGRRRPSAAVPPHAPPRDEVIDIVSSQEPSDVASTTIPVVPRDDWEDALMQHASRLHGRTEGTYESTSRYPPSSVMDKWPRW
ncbi:hypothetical protein BUALT_Bualt16G0078600 [Buddleja alternifolia]|uniref:DDE Tnp4 domain-containing protein n=1 Tax=Buddleja alternifolia TaxID=168488 RepID=A0AAV6WJ48_9LAMI|nr:hypothetical protein BUALT_Bualt16G0078600 [Buddleja alternifolia]